MSFLTYLALSIFVLSSLVAVEAFVTPTSSLTSCSSALSATTDTDSTEDILAQMDTAKQILYRAAETKQEDPDVVIDALLDLEKFSRKANKADPTLAETTLKNLSEGGVNWRLIFTTGTIETQRKLGDNKINYFPLKATQSFDSSSDPQDWVIQNGIAVGDFDLLKFQGDFDWTFSEKSGMTKVTFDFTRIMLLNGFLDIPLKQGEAASLGAKSGLGSENNVDLQKKGKRPFFNWISADEKIATARGGGGGIALWKRI
eukprot:CAMPEP_0116142936 /NCGR_PEP_ID=MMETSP0329-20121206/15177_1 /TAXON_ID=697910 /ORGANISM="Pseudo-nitzschia arenysensis, Strain B593" /LENGTH=257 /DNA_ID=CAMNT_0003638211 /DNA_START=177 /DNA_END=950 /DNA_ORIENTATION=-